MQARARAKKKNKTKKTDDWYFFVSLYSNIRYWGLFHANYVWKNLCFPYLSLAKTHQEFCVYTCLLRHSWTWICRNTLQRPFLLAKNKVPTLNECSHRFHLFCTTILRPSEQYGKEIVYLAVMFLTLNNQYQKHITSVNTIYKARNPSDPKNPSLFS